MSYVPIYVENPELIAHCQTHVLELCSPCQVHMYVLDGDHTCIARICYEYSELCRGMFDIKSARILTLSRVINILSFEAFLIKCLQGLKVAFDPLWDSCSQGFLYICDFDLRVLDSGFVVSGCMHRNLFLPPMSAVKVIESVPSFCVCVCVCLCVNTLTAKPFDL